MRWNKIMAPTITENRYDKVRDIEKDIQEFILGYGRNRSPEDLAAGVCRLINNAFQPTPKT